MTVAVKTPSLSTWTCYEKGLFKFFGTLAARPKTIVGSAVAAGGAAVVHFGALPVVSALAGSVLAFPALVWAGLAIAWFPKPRGPHRVGSFDMEVEVAATGTSERYKLPVRVYFPATYDTPKQGLCKMAWLPAPNEGYWEGFASMQGLHLKVTKAILYLLKTVKMEAYENQTLADGKWPVAIFSHGLFGTRSMYSAYCTEIASQGYVVLAPEHMDGSALFAQSSEKGVHFIKDTGGDLRPKQLQQRVVELEALWRHLPQMQDAKHFDLTHCSLTGHSFGGATALLAGECDCFRGKSTVVIMDPWMEPAKDLLVKCSSPLLVIMTCSMLFPTNVQLIVKALAMAEGNRQSALMMELAGARHQDMSDVPFILHIPSGMLTTSSQTRLGKGMWEQNADLVLHFLRARGRMDKQQMSQVDRVPRTLRHPWQEWIDASGIEK
mmetsp:Transcript_73057/g.136488  ORF Transcript_73057/g.136488 Transcript_73057/m.136488 type:complete len:437 (-) Transcript_73057:29-1339(-)